MYGPRQDPHGEAGVVAIFLGALADGAQARIFGDGKQTRDYVYVGDVARATVSALGQEGGVFNIGTGPEVSVNELYDLCRQAAGSDARPSTRPPRLGELQRSVLDPGLAARAARVHADGRTRGRARRDVGVGAGRAEGVAARRANRIARGSPARRSRCARPPWRIAAFVAGAIALVETLILLVLGGGALAEAVSTRVEHRAQEQRAAEC